MSISLILEIFETDMNIRALLYYETPTQYGLHECFSTCLHVGVGWIGGKIVGQVQAVRESLDYLRADEVN